VTNEDIIYGNYKRFGTKKFENIWVVRQLRKLNLSQDSEEIQRAMVIKFGNYKRFGTKNLICYNGACGIR
jgi:hypothetical protein